MNSVQFGVRLFHMMTGSHYELTPKLPPKDVVELRNKLIREEATELEEAFEAGNLVQIADAIGDLLYVTYGAAVACGIDMQPICEEIQRSNMTKVGGEVRKDGKILKPKNFKPPVLRPIIDRQIKEGNRERRT